MQKFSIIITLALGALAFGGCGSESDDPQKPTICPVEPEIVLNTTSHYIKYLTTADNQEVGASIEVAQPGGAKVVGQILSIDGADVLTAGYPESIVYPAQELAHGAHTLDLKAIVEIDSLRLVRDVIADGKFYIFDRIPLIDTKATVDVAVGGVSTKGEEHYEMHQCVSTPSPGSRLVFPASWFAWTPAAGTCSALDVSLSVEAEIISVPEGLTATLSDLKWNIPDGESIASSTALLHWDNPVSFKQWHGLTPSAVLRYSGTYEGIELRDSTITGWVVVVE